MAENPNARVKLEPLNPVERYQKESDVYDLQPKVAGFEECISRRPHVAGMTDIIPDADADQIEGFYEGMGMPPSTGLSGATPSRTRATRYK